MKKLPGLVPCLGLAIAVVAAGFQACSRRPASVPASPAPGELGVEEFMRNVDLHRGPVTVEGVVSGAAGGTVTLIDICEFRACRVTTCAELVLPVPWSEPMPTSEQIVRIEGEVQESAGKMIFVASGLEVLPAEGAK